MLTLARDLLAELRQFWAQRPRKRFPATKMDARATRLFAIGGIIQEGRP